MRFYCKIGMFNIKSMNCIKWSQVQSLQFPVFVEVTVALYDEITVFTYRIVINLATFQTNASDIKWNL